jgi:hypothetical protein
VVPFVMLALGCGIIRTNKTSLSSSVSVVQDNVQDVGTLHREDYRVLESANGQAQAQQAYLLWFPVGVQKTRTELVDDAVYQAIGSVEGCDALLLPHSTTRTVVIPLLVVNFVTRRITLRGRCIGLLGDDELYPGGRTPPTLTNAAVGSPP